MTKEKRNVAIQVVNRDGRGVPRRLFRSTGALKNHMRWNRYDHSRHDVVTYDLDTMTKTVQTMARFMEPVRPRRDATEVYKLWSKAKVGYVSTERWMPHVTSKPCHGTVFRSPTKVVEAFLRIKRRSYLSQDPDDYAVTVFSTQPNVTPVVPLADFCTKWGLEP